MFDKGVQREECRLIGSKKLVTCCRHLDQVMANVFYVVEGVCCLKQLFIIIIIIIIISLFILLKSWTGIHYLINRC